MAVLMGLYAGVLFITAAGNADSITKARSILLYAIVGIAVAVLAFSLVAISKSVFSVIHYSDTSRSRPCFAVRAGVCCWG